MVPSCMAASLELDYRSLRSGWGQGLFCYVLGQGTFTDWNEKVYW